MLRICSYYNSLSISELTSENSDETTISPALGTNGGRSKSNTVFMHFCTECNWKSLNFDTLAKIKEPSVLEVFVSLR